MIAATEATAPKPGRVVVIDKPDAGQAAVYLARTGINRTRSGLLSRHRDEFCAQWLFRSFESGDSYQARFELWRRQRVGHASPCGTVRRVGANEE